MLNEKTLRLFAAVHETSGGNFKIIEESDLVSLFPESEGVDGAAVREMISALEEQNFVDVRYCDDGEYCLRSLSAGVNFLKEANAGKRKCPLPYKAQLALVFLSALLGGFLGALCAFGVAL